MIDTNQKTSLLLPFQLPEYIRDDASYEKFVLFLQAYYEWMEQTGNPLDAAKNILNYNDIDKTTSDFLNYFQNDFLPYFPKDILVDKEKVIKIAKELYQSKGTPASYKFLFRVLYNSDVDFFYTKDAVLKASSGKWYISKSLKLSSLDKTFLSINNLKVFGETTKSTATIENAVVAGNKIEVFISDIERLFQSGEFIRVVDSQNKDVYFLNGNIVNSNTVGAKILRSKIVGQISQIKINPNYRGSFYSAGDPIVIYGGLNSADGVGGSAFISETTSGSIQRILVVDGGYGYTGPTDNNLIGNAHTNIVFTNLTPGAQTPIAIVGSLDPNAANNANVTLIAVDTLGLKSGLQLSNTYAFLANANATVTSTLANSLTFISFSAKPISSVIVQNGGGGLSTVPTISAFSYYNNDRSTSNVSILTLTPAEKANSLNSLKNLGILAPIKIINGGTGYQVNDKIIFTGGDGYGAYANVTSLTGSNTINSVSYVMSPNTINSLFPLGGVGYKSTNLPTLTVSTVGGNNAVLVVPGILGDAAAFSSTTDRIGAITTISITDNGQDYIATPNISLKIQDIAVSNIANFNIPSKNDIVYQGTSLANSTYKAIVDSISILVPASGANSIYVLRVYNYSSKLNASLPLVDDTSGVSMKITSNSVPSFWLTDNRYSNTTPYLLSYGDGTAKATATFLNGLVLGSGQYLDSTGQPSSFDVLQSEDYNNYTYQITLEKEIAKYRNILLNLLHPTGMKVIGRYALNSNASSTIKSGNGLQSGYLLTRFVLPNTFITINASNTNYSNNIINFNNMPAGSNLANILTQNNIIAFTTVLGDSVYAEINTVNSVSNTITLMSNVSLYFANVANVATTANSAVISIKNLSGSYDIINNKNYTYPQYPIRDIIKVGDVISIDNNPQYTVVSLDYINNTVSVNTGVANTVNSYISVNRTLLANAGLVYIYNVNANTQYP